MSEERFGLFVQASRRRIRIEESTPPIISFFFYLPLRLARVVIFCCARRQELRCCRDGPGEPLLSHRFERGRLERKKCDFFDFFFFFTSKIFSTSKKASSQAHDAPPPARAAPSSPEETAAAAFGSLNVGTSTSPTEIQEEELLQLHILD